MVGEVKALVTVVQGLMMESSEPTVDAQRSTEGAEVKVLVK